MRGGKTFSLGAFAATVALLAYASPASAGLPQPVKVEAGLLQGAAGKDPSVTAFLGVPYAAAPTGELRWKPPQGVKPWEGVRKVDQLGPMCPRPPGGNSTRLVSEDCLSVDIWTAASSANERRPVMVFFHGGDAGYGAASNAPDAGEGLAKKGVVVVNVDYRGGIFAHLATPELTRESGHNASGDYGIMDDIAALKWVKANIAAFGGDPSNVTLFGQSYGAGSEHFISLSPMAKGLFSKIIFQSHARYPRDPDRFTGGYRTLKEAEADGQKFMDALGVHDLQTMRSVPWEKLVEAQKKLPDIVWLNVLDGYVVPRGNTATYADAAQADVTVIAGNNHDEGGAAPATAFDLITGGTPARGAHPAPLTIAEYKELANEKFGPFAAEFYKLYPATTDKEAFNAASNAARDSNRISTWMWASVFTQKRAKPAYTYFWTHAPPGKDHDLAGAFHGSEIPYINLRPSAAWTDDDRRISDTMSGYWVNFAKTGNPNGPGLPNWPAFDAKAERTMELGDAFQPIALAEPAKLDFWRRFYASQPAR